MLRALFCGLCFLVLPVAGWAAEEPIALPPLATRVTDLTATLDPNQTAMLDASLAQIERERGAQVAILLLPTTAPETIEAFGIRLADAWKLGRPQIDDGVIIVVAKDDRAARIEVGQGLEGLLPDAVAHRIVADTMVPRFKAGDFAGGLGAAVALIGTAISEEALPMPARAAPASQGSDNHVLLLFLALILGSVLRSLLGLAGALIAAAAAGWLAWVIFASWFAAVVAAAIAFVFSFARGGGRGWSAGGPGGGSNGGWSGGSSGGGFSGGGGSFSGGGASGRW